MSSDYYPCMCSAIANHKMKRSINCKSGSQLMWLPIIVFLPKCRQTASQRCLINSWVFFIRNCARGKFQVFWNLVAHPRNGIIEPFVEVCTFRWLPRRAGFLSRFGGCEVGVGNKHKMAGMRSSFPCVQKPYQTLGLRMLFCYHSRKLLYWNAGHISTLCAEWKASSNGVR